MILPDSILASCRCLIDPRGARLVTECREAIVKMIWFWRHSIRPSTLSGDQVAQALYIEAAELQLSGQEMPNLFQTWRSTRTDLMRDGSKPERLLRELRRDTPGMNARLVKFLEKAITRVTPDRRIQEVSRSNEGGYGMIYLPNLAPLAKMKLQ